MSGVADAGARPPVAEAQTEPPDSLADLITETAAEPALADSPGPAADPAEADHTLAAALADGELAAAEPADADAGRAEEPAPPDDSASSGDAATSDGAADSDGVADSDGTAQVKKTPQVKKAARAKNSARAGNAGLNKDTAQAKDAGRPDAASRPAQTRTPAAPKPKRKPAPDGGTATDAAAAKPGKRAPGRPGAPGGAPSAGQGGSPARKARKGEQQHTATSGPPGHPAKAAGTSGRPHPGSAPRGGTTPPAGTPPGHLGEAPIRPVKAGTAAPATAPPKPEEPDSLPPAPEAAPAPPGTADPGPAAAPPLPAAGDTATAAAQVEAAPHEEQIKAKRHVSRRALIQAGLIGAAGIGAVPLIALAGRNSPSNGPQATNLTFSLNSNWLFGGQYLAGSESSVYDDSNFAPVTVPHTVTPLSWRNWNDEAWQQLWIYRRHFNGSQLVNSRGPGSRIMVDFDGVMVNATVMINDQTVSTHQGGYLPFSAELTGHVTAGDNLLSVLVDANCMPVPPMSLGRPPNSIDFFQPGGIYRDVSLRVLPQAFLSDLSAQPAGVLTAQPRVDVQLTIDSALPTHVIGKLLVEMLDGDKLIASRATSLSATTPGIGTVNLTLTGLGPITLWSPANPKLYTVRASLEFPGADGHTLTRQIGFREASFQPDGFYLNGERLQLFGLNRHQLYPYAGMAMPARVQRQDALILKNELNCNMVRCSHYPQSPHFLDACDELGLLVWEEAPGWHNVNASLGWQDLVVQNVRDMVTRDRSRPSVVIWGTRLNETPDVPGLWAATRQAATQLDSSRPSSGAMAYHQPLGWDEDVFAFNDYSHDPLTGAVGLRPALPGLPYLITESVGVAEGRPHHFAWTDPPAVLANQAAMHGQAHSVARSEAAYSGLLGWAGFDYASPEGLDPESVKWAGVADLFRVPKPGAAIYQSQLDPSVRAVIVPVFFWESGGTVPPPDPTAMIASNCERLEIFINGAHVTTGLPATGSPLYRNLSYPPFLVNLPARVPAGTPELLIEGYVGSQQVTELRMSSNLKTDTLAMAVDDPAIVADGSDATRAVFRAVDQYGNQRRYPAGVVTLTVDGPATLIGDNPFAFGDYGGLGAVWIRSQDGRIGAITLAATEPDLGQAEVKIQAVQAIRGSQLR